MLCFLAVVLIWLECQARQTFLSNNLSGAGKPRGYAFIEYEHKNNMKEAYKRADGKKVEGKRVVVDVERGRTVPNWSAAFQMRCKCTKICKPIHQANHTAL